MPIVHQVSSQSKSDCLDEVLGQMRDFVRQVAEHRQCVYEVGKRLFQWLLQLGLLLLKEYFLRLGSGDEGEQVEVDGLGRVKRSARL